MAPKPPATPPNGGGRDATLRPTTGTTQCAPARVHATAPITPARQEAWKRIVGSAGSGPKDLPSGKLPRLPFVRNAPAIPRSDRSMPELYRFGTVASAPSVHTRGTGSGQKFTIMRGLATCLASAFLSGRGPASGRAPPSKGASDRIGGRLRCLCPPAFRSHGRRPLVMRPQGRAERC